MLFVRFYLPCTLACAGGTAIGGVFSWQDSLFSWTKMLHQCLTQTKKSWSQSGAIGHIDN